MLFARAAYPSANRCMTIPQRRLSSALLPKLWKVGEGGAVDEISVRNDILDALRDKSVPENGVKDTSRDTLGDATCSVEC